MTLVKDIGFEEIIEDDVIVLLVPLGEILSHEMMLLLEKENIAETMEIPSMAFKLATKVVAIELTLTKEGCSFC